MMWKRITVSADQRSLDTLAAEAGRRSVSLNMLLSEAVEEKAESIRSARRPRLGVARSRDGRSAAGAAGGPVAENPA